MNTKELQKNDYRIAGRTTYVDEILYLGFSGCFIEFETDSSLVEIDYITDKELEEESLLGKTAVYIDGEKAPLGDIILDEYKKHIQVDIKKDCGTNNTHILRIEKISEAAFGLVGIAKVLIEESAAVRPTVAKSRKIEFIGDSITCGYGVGANDPLMPFRTDQESCEEAFAIRTARQLDAEFQLVSWSGTGTLTNWVPEDVNEPLDEMLMPRLYKYRDLRLAEKLGMEPEVWDNSQYIPELIVINLGTNDDSYVRKLPEREQEYIPTFDTFLEQVHEANPGSAILWILGMMGQNLCHVQEERIKQFSCAHPDVHIGYIWMPEQNSEQDGYAADYHPSIATHIKSTEYLLPKIQEFMNW